MSFVQCYLLLSLKTYSGIVRKQLFYITRVHFDRNQTNTHAKR